ncbi:MAG: hypothetical protein LJE95_08735 [Acidobacteria bacterium]|nr:hypothetical protein [Acidobacteriota bacterium]
MTRRPTDTSASSSPRRASGVLRGLRDFFLHPAEEPSAPRSGVHEKFRVFSRLLDHNGQILQLIADLEEKALGEYLFDTSYINSTLAELRATLEEMTDDLAAIGGRRYAPLKARMREIVAETEALVEGTLEVREDALTLPLASIDGSRAWSVGHKTSQLGELRSRLALPVPDGFAITAWAYQHFMTSNALEEPIRALLEGVDLTSFERIAAVSERIRDQVLASSVPDDLAAEIRSQLADLGRRSGCTHVALRSSALGEDGDLSFAGQYLTLLNVPLEEVVDRYREVVAGRFTPRAIAYLGSHTSGTGGHPMSVCCLEMVRARSSGVLYTRDPLHPDRGSLVIHSIRGLGPPLVDGKVTPDVFRMSRADLGVIESRTSRQPFALTASSGAGVEEHPLPAVEAAEPSLTPATAKRLAELALRIERDAGTPRDIEWAVDDHGHIVLLQSRPLRIFGERAQSVSASAPADAKVLLSGGATACPGAASGPAHVVHSTGDLDNRPARAVIVAPRPLPGLVTVLDSVAAIVVGVGGLASHLATVAREYGVPMMVGVEGIEELPEGLLVTVDATAGTVYDGEHASLVAARAEEYESLQEEPIFALLRRVLSRVAPLNLLHPSTPDFTIESCRTIHDVTRFAHQRAMEELFEAARKGSTSRRLGLRLKTSIPLPVTIIHLDPDVHLRLRGRREVKAADLQCPPMEALWSGMEEEGWPRPPGVDMRGLVSVMATHMMGASGAEFQEDSFAILTRDYMLLSLRMGYHFTTVEAMCSESAARNSIRMQYKAGGAPIDRRARRVKLIVQLLDYMGFESSSAGDFLDSTLAYEEPRSICRTLHLLGRLNILTKQLDMALTSDSVADWYRRDLAAKLGLPGT